MSLGGYLETLAARLAFKTLKSLPFATASALGGGIARLVGPRLGVSGRARRHLAMALPGLSPAEITTIVRGMWDNLGRTAAELPHLPRIRLGGQPAIDIVGFETVDRLLAEGRRIVFVSAHIGNWELLPLAATGRGIDLLYAYRAANNPAIDALIQAHRASPGVPKGAQGARALLKHLRGGGHLSFLIDQKMNDGIAVPFFGRLAMTAAAPVEMAMRYDAVLLPARVIRHPGPRFEIRIEPPVEPDRTLGHHAAVLGATTALNAVIERWVRETPEQWFWLHRRWPSTEIGTD